MRADENAQPTSMSVLPSESWSNAVTLREGRKELSQAIKAACSWRDMAAGESGTRASAGRGSVAILSWRECEIVNWNVLVGGMGVGMGMALSLSRLCALAPTGPTPKLR